MRLSLLLSVIPAAATLAACATAPAAGPAPAITPAMVLRGEPLTGAEDPPPVADEPVLALDEPMRAFLDRYVQKDGHNYIRLHQLLDAIIDETTFGLEYDQRTRTAAATFRDRSGNCLSFTNMFVAMARHVRLEVSYQEVDIPPDWNQEGDILLLSRHINVYVDLGGDRNRVVDFNIEDFRASYDRRRVADDRALAHYYNNLGVERMQAGQPVEALRYFRKAVERDGRFAPVWSNLGTLYSRGGEPAWAEAAWREALVINPRELVAMSNLSRLYERQGRTEEAERYRGNLRRHRMENPYYRYYLARQAFLSRDYGAAIGHLKYAIRRKDQEDTFYLLLGLSYLQEGNSQAARRWLAKAEEVAGDEVLKRNYQDKMQRLLGAAAGS